MKFGKKSLLILASVTALSACALSGFKNLTAEGMENVHTEYQLAYLTSEDYNDTGFACGTASWSAPNPIVLSWDTEGSAKEYTVTISEDEVFDENDITYVTKEKTLNFYNSKIGTTYYWNVKAGEITSETATFTTKSDGPRNLFIEGVENARDIGGWGNIIKQGMLYRSGRLNESGETLEVNITEFGISEMNNHLKIKTQIDLRRPATNETGTLTDTSILGEHVNYVNLPMAYGGNNILTFTGKLSGDQTEYNNPQQIKAFFEILADENNYPIHYHCSIGKDRTGCLSYLVAGLLGADEEYLMRDYMFTNYAKIGGFAKPTEVTSRYGETIAEYENGSNTQEKIYNYLSNEVGISTSTLDSVISILKAN